MNKETKKPDTGEGIPHDVYDFELGSHATIFYNQCREACKNHVYADKKGLIVISGKTVTVPEWMPLYPFEYLNKKTRIL